MDLVDALHRDAPGGEILGRARRRQQAEAQRRQFLAGLDHRLLVLVLDRDEDRAGDRQAEARAELGFGEGAGEAEIQPHDLAGRFHLRPQDDVDAGEAGEGKDRFLDGGVAMVASTRPKSASRSPAATRAAILAMGTPVALATKGTVWLA
jgi:hypothetical protein